MFKLSRKHQNTFKLALYAFVLSISTIGDPAMADSPVSNTQLINFEERRAVALARITNVALLPTGAQERAAREGIFEINTNFANAFAQSVEVVNEVFNNELKFYQSFSESRVREILEESYATSNFGIIEESYLDELIQFVSESVANIYLVGKIRIDEILFDEYISMLPIDARQMAHEELTRLLYARPDVLGSAPDTKQPEINLGALQTTVAALVARRLATSAVGQRLLAGLGRRLFRNAVGRGAIAVLAPGGVLCGPAVLLCEAGVFVGAIGWESIRNRSNVVEAVAGALKQQSADLRDELQSLDAIDEIWAMINNEATGMLRSYRNAVEEIMLETFDNVVKQNADFASGDLSIAPGDIDQINVFRRMASTYGDRYLEYTWADRYSFLHSMGNRARLLLDTHNSPILKLYLSHPEMLVRVVRGGASESLLSAILQSEDAPGALSDVSEAIRGIGRLTREFDPVLVDVLRFRLPIQPREIVPHGIRIAASNAPQLREMTTGNREIGGILYAQVLRGVFSSQVLDFILRSTNSPQMAEVFSQLPEQNVSSLARNESLFTLSAFISGFTLSEAADLLASPQAHAYLDIFSHRSGGREAVRAWARLMDQYERPPLPWMQKQFLWIADRGYEPSGITLLMINAAYDSSGPLEFLSKPILVWWAYMTGWAWGILLFLIGFVTLLSLFLPIWLRGFLRGSSTLAANLKQKAS